MTTLLQVDQLQIGFHNRDGGETVAVEEVQFSIDAGELVALVGESGCGKSITALALPGLLPESATLGRNSSIRFDGAELVGLSESELRPYRGARIAMIFQDPMSSLNPVMRVGDQVAEAIRAHNRVPRGEARQRAIALFREVGIADPDTRVDAWPHQLSGGMRQRVMIAIALASQPELLIADEPTTALDVTVQAQILELLDALRKSRRLAVLLITHDLGIVAGRADRVMVMYAGKIVETAPTTELFRNPYHPYTQGLFDSLPRLDTMGDRLTPIPGSVPPPQRWPSGCRFHPRCPVAIEKCVSEAPELDPIGPGRCVACWVAHAKVSELEASR